MTGTSAGTVTAAGTACASDRDYLRGMRIEARRDGSELVIDPDGREKFRKYVPFESFVNTIEDYPYPYVIGRLCWEFPCAVPSDWEAHNLHGSNNPRTVEDWQGPTFAGLR
mgnify:CR=1 FL=1